MYVQMGSYLCIQLVGGGICNILLCLYHILCHCICASRCAFDSRATII